MSVERKCFGEEDVDPPTPKTKDKGFKFPRPKPVDDE